ncbi:unnamed protein product [Acanthoscelides obtectus]|uniref:Lysosomal acid phosphatase n=2 Tax=Acanthoscelides obtectus TaxID=200917 RepID=A0A9P0PLD9_ACAOB|nr:unnamed protein product [Acanthoscelides obtectus]CAK1627797.1 Testicular acid phosphatase homolog [Acanthoscelides obtectus]
MLTGAITVCLLLSTSQAGPPLKQLHILFRHGDRSPSGSYPTDPYWNYSWPGGWGSLTNVGKLQMYKLGQILRKQYSDFIPAQYSAKNIAVNSSSVDRCIMSALAFSAGMFPPTGEQVWTQEILWQPIPVHYLPRDLDTTLVMKKPCPKYDAMFKDVENSPVLKALERKYKPLLQHLSKHTGMEIKTVRQVESLYIILHIQRYHNLTLPSWLNDSMMADMKMLAARTLAYYSETEYMKRIKGGSFLKHVLRSMESILNGQEEAQVNLYSAHDITLVHVLRGLHLVDDTVKPDYGAYLIFELYTDGEVKNRWIRLFHPKTKILVQLGQKVHHYA